MSTRVVLFSKSIRVPVLGSKNPFIFVIATGKQMLHDTSHGTDITSSGPFSQWSRMPDVQTTQPCLSPMTEYIWIRTVLFPKYSLHQFNFSPLLITLNTVTSVELLHQSYTVTAASSQLATEQTTRTGAIWAIKQTLHPLHILSLKFVITFSQSFRDLEFCFPLEEK